MTKQIKISGAGISGLTAAINLRKVGYDVTVFEKNNDVGGNHSNDWQGLENWTQEEDVLAFLKRINIGADFCYLPCKEVSVFDWRSEKAIARSDVPFLYLVKRGVEEKSLDQHLKKRALSLGVKIEFNHSVKAEDVDIVATGHFSPMKGLAYGISFKTDLPDNLSVIIDEKLAPGGYGYLIIGRGEAILVVAIMRDFLHVKDYFQQTLARFQQLYSLNLKECKEFWGWMSAAMFHKKEKIYVGEAGGLQDLLWGF